MKSEYLKRLQDIGLEVNEPVKTSNDHHDITCLLCGNIFKATPKSKLQNFKKWGAKGCPDCTTKDRHVKQYELTIQTISNMGIELLEEYKGYNRTKHKMRNLNCCGRIFWARPNNVVTGATVCPPCNDDRKRELMRQHNEARHQEALKNMEGFKAYTRRVRVLTEATYRENKDAINPDDFPRGRSGTEGAYHVDHIKSIYRSFHDGDEPEVCADINNLTMLPWLANVKKHKN